MVDKVFLNSRNVNVGRASIASSQWRVYFLSISYQNRYQYRQQTRFTIMLNAFREIFIFSKRYVFHEPEEFRIRIICLDFTMI